MTTSVNQQSTSPFRTTGHSPFPVSISNLAKPILVSMILCLVLPGIKDTCVLSRDIGVPGLSCLGAPLYRAPGTWLSGYNDSVGGALHICFAATSAANLEKKYINFLIPMPCLSVKGSIIHLCVD